MGQSFHLEIYEDPRLRGKRELRERIAFQAMPTNNWLSTAVRTWTCLSRYAYLLEDSHSIVKVKAGKEVSVTLFSWDLLPSFRDIIEGGIEFPAR